MKLTKLSVILPAVLISSVAFAQQPTYVNASGGINPRYATEKKAESQAAQGSQYYIETFNPAKIDDSNEVNLVRYNAYTDELEMKVNDEILVLQPKDNQIIKLVNNTASYEYVAYTDKENITQQHYLVLVSDNPNLKIYKKERITLIPEQQPTGGYQKYKAPMYKKLDPEYYIKMNDGQVVYMSDKKKDVIGLIPGKESALKDFIKENRISTSDDEDLKKLGNYMSTLL